jgi:feruloyl esterase
MITRPFQLFLSAIAVGAQLGGAVRSAFNATQLCQASTFSQYLPANVSVEKVVLVPAGGTYGEGALDLMYPIQPTELPELCAVTIYVQSSTISQYRFGMFLPTTWNERYLALGNGGFGGGINWEDMGSSVKYGFAAVSTDTGHNSTTGDASWAYKNPQKRIDWGWRALNGSVTISKGLVTAYYDEKFKYSYYSGCSTGGRQGLKQVELEPDMFDGVIVGASAWCVFKSLISLREVCFQHQVPAVYTAWVVERDRTLPGVYPVLIAQLY